MFQLKKGKEGFTVVEGPFAGRSFTHGQPYAEVPPGTSGKFEEIKKAAPAKAPADETEKPAKAESKKTVVTFPPSGKTGGKS